MACRSLARCSIQSSTLCLRASRISYHTRLFSTTHNPLANDPAQQPSSPTRQASSIPPTTPPADPSSTAVAAEAAAQQRILRKRVTMNTLTAIGDSVGGGEAKPLSGFGLSSPYDKGFDPNNKKQGEDEYHLHVYSTKHNTHLTLADEDRKALISISAGNLGFRKSQRGSYDAGFQLMSYLLSRIQQQGLMGKIQKLELCLRGFGQGRDAVLKVMMGTEGTRLKEAVVRIVDKTRLKIGGNRSPSPRRLG